MKKIIMKKYAKIVFKLISPLALSSGNNANSDKDAALDSRGFPYIPASSIAGVCRSALTKGAGDRGETQYTNYYFGYVYKNTGKEDFNVGKTEEQSENSRVIFYDAYINDTSFDNAFRITIRDGVKLNEFKTADKGAKFDMEVVEPPFEGLSFTTYVSQDIYDIQDQDQIDRIIELFRSGQLAFGGKTMRGYGLVALEDYRKAEFSLDQSADVENWISFNMYEDASWDKFEIEPSDADYKHTDIIESASDGHVISEKTKHKLYNSLTLELHPKGAIAIRKYSVRPAAAEDMPEPDYEQLTILRRNSAKSNQEKDNDEVVPVIPGTSWAGAFRHRMRSLGLSETSIHDLFGNVSKKDSHKSNISFSESRFEGAKEKVMTRTAIDRFTGGSVKGSLYTERIYYGGKADLIIAFRRNLTDQEINILAAAIADLHFGFLAVGGLTSIGRGLFTIEKVNDEEMADTQNVFSFLKKKIEEMQKEAC